MAIALGRKAFHVGGFFNLWDEEISKSDTRPMQKSYTLFQTFHCSKKLFW